MYRGRSENLVEEVAQQHGEKILAARQRVPKFDQFYSAPSQAALASEPRLLVGVIENGEYYDAFLAAMAECLADQFGLAVPAWAGERARFLSSPRISVKNPKLRELLLEECPAPFKRRGVIVSGDALARA